MTKPDSTLGRATGWLVAPFFGATSFLRRSRTFHPRGPTYHARVTRHEAAPPALQDLARRLEGPALARFSGALWKHTEGMLDVLGCALRCRRDERATPEPDLDDQDLLFATIRRPWTMPFAPFTTDQRDYLANDYFAVSPFDAGVPDRARVYLRLRPEGERAPGGGGARADRLDRAVREGHAALVLEASASPFGPWAPFARVALERRANVDGEALEFRPFRAGRGVEPKGFVHALRVGVYALSQRARPKQRAA